MTRKLSKRHAETKCKSANNSKVEPIHSLFNFGELDTPAEKKAYRKLTTDPRSLRVIERMKRWGVDAENIDSLLRKVAGAHSEWLKPSDDPRRTRYARMARAMIEMRRLIESDPRLKGIRYYATLNPRLQEPRWIPISDIFFRALDQLRPSVHEIGERKIAFKTWVARALCHEIELLKAMAPWFALADDDPKIVEEFHPKLSRSPNVETATLLSVAFGLKITADDVTQARKRTRRRYQRE